MNIHTATVEGTTLKRTSQLRRYTCVVAARLRRSGRWVASTWSSSEQRALSHAHSLRSNHYLAGAYDAVAVIPCACTVHTPKPQSFETRKKAQLTRWAGQHGKRCAFYIEHALKTRSWTPEPDYIENYIKLAVSSARSAARYGNERLNLNSEVDA